MSPGDPFKAQGKPRCGKLSGPQPGPAQGLPGNQIQDRGNSEDLAVRGWGFALPAAQKPRHHILEPCSC